MIRTQGDLMYLLGVEEPRQIADDVQAKTSTPTTVSVLKSGVNIGPLLDDSDENKMGEVELRYPFTEEEWEAAIENVQSHAYKFLAKRSATMQTLFSDLVDRPIRWCIDCGSLKLRLEEPCRVCRKRNS